MQGGGNSSNGLKASDVDPRLVFHDGVPSCGIKFASDNIQKILALSTKYVHPSHFNFVMYSLFSNIRLLNFTTIVFEQTNVLVLKCVRRHRNSS